MGFREGAGWGRLGGGQEGNGIIKGFESIIAWEGNVTILSNNNIIMVIIIVIIITILYNYSNGYK